MTDVEDSTRKRLGSSSHGRAQADVCDWVASNGAESGVYRYRLQSSPYLGSRKHHAKLNSHGDYISASDECGWLFRISAYTFITFDKLSQIKILRNLKNSKMKFVFLKHKLGRLFLSHATNLQHKVKNCRYLPDQSMHRKSA